MKLVKLFKNNCDPCERVSNYLNDKGVEPNEQHNIMEDMDSAIKYGVMSVPVLILLDEEGNEVQRSIGFKPNEIEQMISQL